MDGVREEMGHYQDWFEPKTKLLLKGYVTMYQVTSVKSRFESVHKM